MPYYEKLFGGLYYPATNRITWPELLIGSNFGFRQLSDYSSLEFTFTATLRAATIYESTIDAKTPESAMPSGASTTYNPGVNATRLEFSLPLRWHPKYCTNVIVHTDPTCVKYFNKPLELLTFFYDNRWEYWTGPALVADGGTAGFGGLHIYRNSLRSLIAGAPAENPFKIVGNRATAQGDILPMLRQIILSTRKQGDVDGIDYIPPRMVINGVPETDDEYFGDFAINDFALGYENSGLADISYEIDAFSLVGVPSVTAR
jgi:hypothetical protein